MPHILITFFSLSQFFVEELDDVAVREIEIYLVERCLRVLKKSNDFLDHNFCAPFLGKTEYTRAYGGERDAFELVGSREVQGVPHRISEFSFFVALAPSGPHGMDHVPGFEISSGREGALTHRHMAYPVTFFLDGGPSFSGDSPCHAPAMLQVRICRIHYCVCVAFRKIAFNDPDDCAPCGDMPG
jgi:hypothetical protein